MKSTANIKGRILKVVMEPAGNKHLPAPLEIGEKVIVIDKGDDTQYVKVRHNRGKNVSTFSKRYFDEITEKDRKDV